MKATTGKYEKGASIRTEFDVPKNFSLSAGGDVPWCVLVEAGQCDLMLISYLGVDFDMKSDRVYRLLNTTLTFYGVATEGQTLVYDIKIDRYLFRPDGSLHMFFFQYDCFVDGKLLIEMRNGCAGFFTDEELANGKGIQRKTIKVKHPQGPPPYISPISKSHYDESEMLYLCEQGERNGWGSILSNAGNFKYKLCTKKILMIDRITKVEPRGGDLGLGFIVGEKKLVADDWKFHSHFKDDPVLAGSLVSDGCSQLLRVFMIHTGLHLVERQDKGKLMFRPVHGQPNKVRCRGQISPPKLESTLRYELSVVKTGLDQKGDPYCIANVDIVLVENGAEKIVVDFTGIALRLTTATNEIVGKKIVTPTSVPKNWKRCTKMTWHPLSPKPSFIPCGFAPREIKFLPFPNNPNDRDHTPGKLPLTWFNMAEFMSGHISKCLGKDFARFDHSKTSRSPAFDLALVTRVLTYDSKTQTSVSEFDCPRDAWFFRDGTSRMPHCILMEILLQNAGVLTSLERAPLKMKKKDLCFRNLDAKATLTKLPDLRGKTIVNVAKVTGFKLIRGNMAIHRFECSLSTKEDGTFYSCETSFGWFTPETMSQQKGLDGGRKIGLYHERQNLKIHKISTPRSAKSRPEMLRLVDKNTVYASEKYVVGSAKIDPTSWWFKCHFVGDPVTVIFFCLFFPFFSLRCTFFFCTLALKFTSKYTHFNSH
jgi:3-hydroxymyristoyl/3-hydroxydecanoyl-(acyl carrier protein) dehydratase